MKASIEHPDGTSVVTEDPAVIAQANTDGWSVFMWYKEDGSDRPEIIARIQAEQSRKTEQDIIDITINKPNLLNDLKEIPYQEKNEGQRTALSFADLAEYHSNMVLKQNRISEILKLKGLDNIIANWDIEGAKTLLEIEDEIKTINEANLVE